MVDLIFVVDNPMRWHTENLMMNSSHYSFLKYFGPKTISKIQERLACGVYYNTLINMEDQVNDRNSLRVTGIMFLLNRAIVNQVRSD